MISATIHLGNRDWDALVSDFVALGFLPANSDRGRIIPVMDKVLSPYLRGGGAKAFNFQVSSISPAAIYVIAPHQPHLPLQNVMAAHEGRPCGLLQQG